MVWYNFVFSQLFVISEMFNLGMYLKYPQATRVNSIAKSLLTVRSVCAVISQNFPMLFA